MKVGDLKNKTPEPYNGPWHDKPWHREVLKKQLERLWKKIYRQIEDQKDYDKRISHCKQLGEI